MQIIIVLFYTFTVEKITFWFFSQFLLKWSEFSTTVIDKILKIIFTLFLAPIA